jgi:starch phosphorylase
MMKASMKMAMAQFCSLRMISEYEERFYLPASRRYEELVADGGNGGQPAQRTAPPLSGKMAPDSGGPPVRSAEGPFRVNQSFEVTTVVSAEKSARRS